jgi:hypothetical protein
LQPFLPRERRRLEKSRGARGLILFVLAVVSLAVLRADVIEDSASLENVFDEAGALAADEFQGGYML